MIPFAICAPVALFVRIRKFRIKTAVIVERKFVRKTLDKRQAVPIQNPVDVVVESVAYYSDFMFICIAVVDESFERFVDFLRIDETIEFVFVELFDSAAKQAPRLSGIDFPVDPILHYFLGFFGVSELKE
jgi:hypothetical protein